MPQTILMFYQLLILASYIIILIQQNYFISNKIFRYFGKTALSMFDFNSINLIFGDPIQGQSIKIR